GPAAGPRRGGPQGPPGAGQRGAGAARPTRRRPRPAGRWAGAGGLPAPAVTGSKDWLAAAGEPRTGPRLPRPTPCRSLGGLWPTDGYGDQRPPRGPGGAR